MLESAAKDPFNPPWWSESSFDASPSRNSSFARINCNLSRLHVESDDHPRSELDGTPKKLTWISREDTNSPARNSLSNGRASIQNGSAHGLSARFGGVLDSPGRGIQNPAESPARRGESVRRIRTPSVDFDKTEVPSSATPSRRLRSASFKDGPAAAKSDYNVVREASAIRRVLTVRDQWTSPKPTVQPSTKQESPCMNPIGDSPESDKMVVSYLAEETDRIIKGRIQKLKLRSQSNAADQELQATDHERSSVRELRNANNGQLGRQHSNFSFLQADKTKAETVGTYDSHREHRTGELERESYIHSSGYSSLPGSPLIGPVRTISTTMENYLENRRRGSNLGPQIVGSPRPVSALSPTASNPHLAVLREANQLENPSSSRRIGASRRHDSFTASRAALSPLNGNEDMTHSTTSLSQRKKDYSAGGHGEDSNRGRRKDSKESVQMQGENGFPSRLLYWAEFLGKSAMDSSEGLRHLTQQTEELISPSGRKQLESKIKLHSKGGRGQSPLDRRQIDSYIRHPGARSHSQRYEEVGWSLLPDKKLGPGSRGDKHNSSRRSQSCRRDPVIYSMPDSVQENEALSPARKLALVSGLDTSSESKSSRRFSVDNTFSSSSDSLQEQLQFPSLAQTEKSRYLVRDPSERKHSRRFSISMHESGGNMPLSSSKRYSVSVPESGGNPLLSYSAPLQGPSPYLAQIYESDHLPSSQTRIGGLDSQLSENKKNVPQQFQRPKMSHKNSHSLDRDTYKKLSISSKDNRSGPVVTTSTSVSQACSMNSPKTAKTQPCSPGTSFQRWIANQFKIRSKCSSSSTRRDCEPPDEQKSRKKSPWRTKPAELFQGITRRRGSSTPRSSTGVSLFDASSRPNSQQGNPFEGGSPSHSHFTMRGPDPWHHRVMYTEPGSTPPHRNTYLLPSISTMSPAHAHTTGLQNLFKNRRPG